MPMHKLCNWLMGCDAQLVIGGMARGIPGDSPREECLVGLFWGNFWGLIDCSLGNVWIIF